MNRLFIFNIDRVISFLRLGSTHFLPDFSKFHKQNYHALFFASQFNGVCDVCSQSWLPFHEGGGGAGGIPNNGKYGCAGRALGFLGVNFSPGMKFLAIFVIFNKRVNNKWPTY